MTQLRNQGEHFKCLLFIFSITAGDRHTVSESDTQVPDTVEKECQPEAGDTRARR